MFWHLFGRFGAPGRGHRFTSLVPWCFRRWTGVRFVIVLCVCCVLIGVYCGGPHGQFRQTIHHPRQKCHDFSLDTWGARLRAPPCTQAVLMASVAWVLESLAKLSMRATAVHANYHATHAQHINKIPAKIKPVPSKSPVFTGCVQGGVQSCSY